MLLKSIFSSRISSLIFHNTVQSVSLIDLTKTVCLLSNSKKESNLFRSQIYSESLHLLIFSKEYTLKKSIELSVLMCSSRGIARMNNFMYLALDIFILFYFKKLLIFYYIWIAWEDWDVLGCVGNKGTVTSTVRFWISLEKYFAWKFPPLYFKWFSSLNDA